MLKNDYDGQDCSVARALEVVGERWTLLIVRELLKQPSRFLELERTLGIAKNVLTNRLEKMVALEIVEKTSVSETRDWGEYRLTARGRDLFPVINALMAWGDTYAAPNGPPLLLVHKCGHLAGHRVVCECCGEDLRLTEVHVADAGERRKLLKSPAARRPRGA
jgi:DNA-binding HxlR family transcriptional regulator